VRRRSFCPSTPSIWRGHRARCALPSVLSGVQLPADALSLHGDKQFQLLDEDGRLLAVVHVEAGRTVYDRVFPELTRRREGRGGA